MVSMTFDLSSQVVDPYIEIFDLQPSRPGALNGLTFAVKDLIDVKDYVTGCGSPAWKKEHAPASSHAVCVNRLLQAGARCIGKTICDEFAFSLYGKNFFYGTPLNPKAPQRVPGGSSSGSASAVASGKVDFALGTDTAGSVRVPASNCGIFGMRPSHGRCSLSGVAICSPTFDTVGIFSQSLDILSQAAEVVLGLEKGNHLFDKIYLIDEAFALSDPASSSGHVLERLKKAFPGRVINISLSEILEISEGLQACVECHGLIKNIEAWNNFGRWLDQHRFPLSPKIKENFDYIASLDQKSLAEKIPLREKLRYKLNQFLESGSLLCFPTTAGLPPLISTSPAELKEQQYSRRTLALASIACVGDLPEITVPACETGGIPVGLSFAAASGNDELLIRSIQQLLKLNIFPEQNIQDLP
jgi:amidase